ncbi:MAG: CTB family bacteriocin [Rivularia sp. (in: Bacteria)]|nr:CTB family bacteriocin [Rivularia sp. MS3]
MSNEIKNVNAVELSEQELDIVAGGTKLSFSGLSGSSFDQFGISAGEITFAGPGGGITKATLQLGKTSSDAFQVIEFGV